MIDTYKWLPDCLVLSTASVNRIVNDVNDSSKKEEIINLIEGIKVDWRESVMGFDRAISDNEIIQCLESSIAPKNDLMSYGKVIIDNTIVFAASVSGFVVGLGADLALITFLGRLSNAELGTFLEINIPAFNFYIKGHDVNLYTAVIAGIYSGYHGCNYVTNNMVDRDLVALKHDILECLGNSNTDGIIGT